MHPKISGRIAESILKRLKFDNETSRQVVRLVRCHDQHPALTPTSVRRAANRIGEDLFPAYLDVQRADILAQNPELQGPKLQALREVQRLYEQIIREHDCITLKQLAVGGRDLMEAGIAAGPGLGEMLRYLLELVLEDPARNEKEALIQAALQKMQDG